MRAAAADKALKIAPAMKMSLEEYLEFIEQDELVEVTPQSIRIRKMILDENERKRARSQLKNRRGEDQVNSPLENMGIKKLHFSQ